MATEHLCGRSIPTTEEIGREATIGDGIVRATTEAARHLSSRQMQTSFCNILLNIIMNHRLCTLLLMATILEYKSLVQYARLRTIVYCRFLIEQRNAPQENLGTYTSNGRIMYIHPGANLKQKISVSS